jgi:hypothetical protein
MNYEKYPLIQSLSGHSEVFGLGEASNFGIGEQWVDHAIFHPQCQSMSTKYGDDMWGCDYGTNCIKYLQVQSAKNCSNYSKTITKEGKTANICIN